MTGLWQYPFPLESGEIAVLHLPPDLTRNDAERLKKMIDSLVIETEAEDHPAGPSSRLESQQ